MTLRLLYVVEHVFQLHDVTFSQVFSDVLKWGPYFGLGEIVQNE
jgi:hypothetical protein